MSAADTMPSGNRRLELHLLGRFELRAGETILIDRAWRRRKGKALIKLLALTPGRAMHREHVIETLWPEMDPDAAANNLFKNLHYVRTATDDPLLQSLITHEDNVLALSEDVRLDVDAFRAAAVRANTSRDPTDYSSALALWGGDLLPEDQYEPWVEAPREAIQEIHRTLLLGMAAVLLEHGDTLEAEMRFHEAHRENPLDEAPYIGLMRVYAASGQRDKALRQYEELARMLRTEHDIAPPPGATALRDEIAAAGTNEFGAPRARLLVQEPGRPSVEITLLHDATTIGREPGCQVVLVNRYASRQHARIEHDRGVYTLRDLRSRNGTVLNDRPLRKPAMLSRGDEIRIADALLVFDDGPPEMPTTIGRSGQL
ncbi:MAG: FHA domain-containing protein [Chloroflexi bacterium]|nr:FHA domain-containing protein [Chloroflexota bacterium]